MPCGHRVRSSAPWMKAFSSRGSELRKSLVLRSFFQSGSSLAQSSRRVAGKGFSWKRFTNFLREGRLARSVTSAWLIRLLHGLLFVIRKFQGCCGQTPADGLPRPWSQCIAPNLRPWEVQDLGPRVFIAISSVINICRRFSLASMLMYVDNTYQRIWQASYTGAPKGSS